MHARPVVFLLLILTGMGAGASIRAQTLAEVAKKEEERRKALPAPAKVYTNKDLTTLPGGAAPAPPMASAAQSLADAARAAEDADRAGQPAKSNGPVKDQVYWSGRRKTLQDKLDRDQTFLEALKTRVNSLAADFVNRDDPAQRAVIERERQKAVADLARLQQAIVGGQKAIADLEEEARQAGVPAGWLR